MKLNCESGECDPSEVYYKANTAYCRFVKDLLVDIGAAGALEAEPCPLQALELIHKLSPDSEVMQNFHNKIFSDRVRGS